MAEIEGLDEIRGADGFRETMSFYLAKVGDATARRRLFSKVKSPSNDPRFRELASRDLENMLTDVKLDMQDERFLKPLLVQSVLGHAQNLHGKFRNQDNHYPHATIPDVIAAVGLDIMTIRKHRQDLIDQVNHWVSKALHGSVRRLVTGGGEPLLGVRFLCDYTRLDQVQVLKGMVLAGFMDNYEHRQKTVSLYEGKTTRGGPLTIGGGETYLVNRRTLLLAGLDFEFLANKEHDEEAIKYLKKLGVIVDSRGSGVDSAYVRRKIGGGTSDDLAFIVIGKKHGIDAMLGAFVVDAIDTYDKCVMYPTERGLDEALASYIQRAWADEHGGQKLVSDEEIAQVIYFSAKNNTPKVPVSSSHRRFIQIEGVGYRPVFQSHVLFVNGGEPGYFHVGFNRMPSTEFYEKAGRRIKDMDKK